MKDQSPKTAVEQYEAKMRRKGKINLACLIVGYTVSAVIVVKTIKAIQEMDN